MWSWDATTSTAAGDLRSGQARANAGRGQGLPGAGLRQLSGGQRAASVHRKRSDSRSAGVGEALHLLQRRRAAGATSAGGGDRSGHSGRLLVPRGGRRDARRERCEPWRGRIAAPRYLESLQHLDEVTRRLRRECPWDREQDARSIVPHTVEEAYELADAADRGDPEAMVDELGDVLFQVIFLSLLLEERGEGDLAVVAESCAAKLIRRHPHVFGEIQERPEAEQSSQNAGPDAPRRTPLNAGEVLRNWDQIKQ